MPTIRRAVIQDAMAISLLAAHTFRVTFKKDFHYLEDLNEYCEQTFSYQKIKRSLSKKENLYFVLIEENQLVGYAKLKIELSKDSIIQLQKIYLHEAYIGQGFGKLLLQECLLSAKINGYESVWLAVLQSNLRSVHFYEKNGFSIEVKMEHQIGRNQFIYHKMVLDLDTLSSVKN